MSPMSTHKHELVACPRCQCRFACQVGSINLCQCQVVQLTESQQHYIRSFYQDCLCANCLLDLQTEYNHMEHLGQTTVVCRHTPSNSR